MISLGDQYLASNFSTSAEFPPVQRKVPLELVRCDPKRDESACGLLQLHHTVPSDLMYSSYGYRSGINQTMIDHLGGIARTLEERVGLGPGELVVDIGANDGTTLLAYRTQGAVYVGFEPSDILPVQPTPHLRSINDYFSAASLEKNVALHKARIVTSIAMFYDLENPNAFVGDIAKILADDGLWLLELSYLPSMLEQNSFDTICHEHLSYYALTPLERLLNRHGLEVADAQLNDANGGSIRVTACKQGSPYRARSDRTRAAIYALKKREFEMELDTDRPYAAFAERIEKIRRELPDLLRRLQREKKKVYGYGASTKGNVILQYCGLGPDLITGIADRNPAKVGSKTPGTGIPIVSEEEMRAARPDYLLVLPWHFMHEFRRREDDFVARGGRFIVPVPQVEIV